MIEVGDVGGRLAAPPDLDRLAKRIEEAVAERVADVGVIDPAEPRGLVGELGELGRGRVGTGRAGILML